MRNFRFRVASLLILCVSLLLSACDGKINNLSPPVHDEWTWVRGLNVGYALGYYGVKSVGTDTTGPGARQSAVSWVGSDGSLWLFGGLGFNASDSGSGYLNDLWKFDGTKWIWSGGSCSIDQPGVYGVQGSADAANVPGGRDRAISWVDKSGRLWLFGGAGYDESGIYSFLNDLWKYESGNWIWTSGSNSVDQFGTYGTQGVADSANVPGARLEAMSWIDMNDNLWLFGGLGLDAAGTAGFLNDLWKYDIQNNQWTWMSGSNAVDASGIYSKTSNTSNMPGARHAAVSWIDGQGNLWLFGGVGSDSTGTVGDLNDLWKYDVSNNQWIWISGSAIADQIGIYGDPGVADANNTPGAREAAVSWIDNSGNLWLFGGAGYDYGSGSAGDLADLWKFDGANWTWVNGPDFITAPGVYGTQNLTAGTNLPGTRETSLSWTDKGGNLWLFGGYGCYGTDTNKSFGPLNDLWVYQP
jgi:N-acetylneuraminic acid mutarotase